MRRLLPTLLAGLALAASSARAQSAAQVPVSGEERLSGGAFDPPPGPANTMNPVVDATTQQRRTSRRLRAERRALVAERQEADAARAEAEAARRDLEQDRQVSECLERERDAVEQARCAFSPPAR